MIIGEWHQSYENKSMSKYMGFTIVIFKQDGTGKLGLYSEEGSPDDEIMFTYKVAIDSNYIELTHLPIASITDKDDSVKIN